MPAHSSQAVDYVTLARLLRPQGRKGELLADLLTDSPDRLTAATGVYLVTGAATAPAADAHRTVLESAWMPTGKNAGRIVVKLTGCDSINDAERLAGARLMLPAAERPALEDDTFYISDLIGCRLFDRDTPVGEVVDVEFAMSPDGRARLQEAAPLLCVVPLKSTQQDSSLDAQTDHQVEDEDDIVLIPFVRAQLQAVDLAERRITMTLPEGLFKPTPAESS